MDSDDEFVDCEEELEGLSYSNIDVNLSRQLEQNLDFQRMLRGEVQSFDTLGLDMDEIIETEGFQAESKPTPDSALPMYLSDKTTLEKTKFRHGDQTVNEAISTMFGDFDDLEDLMTNVCEGDDRLKKLVMKSGTGASVEAGQLVRVHYVIGCEFMDDIIESTYIKRKPARFRIGGGEVLHILELATATMKIGETSKFLGTSDIGYGKMGVPLDDTKVIPADARVVIQIELLDAKDKVAPQVETISDLSDAERRQIGFEKLFKHAEEMKNEGNDEFKAGMYDRAKLKYKAAIACAKDMDPITAAETQQFLSLRGVLCKNLCMTCYKLGDVKTALKFGKAAATNLDVSKDIRSKSNYWCAKCYYDMGDYHEGVKYIKVARNLCADSNVTELFDMFQKKENELRNKEKDICARMMKITTNETKEAQKGEKK
ncbi:Inactive peptidyl-prolyl cis-trans isomerase FKBP6 [Orchesella cincta]|uniref:peptidylprolyl isomerase n=1 Tax=Orchesella cincta TaxID=48709 RepID=A0A1D2MEH5_ORCCI|nr:Inactive peptidyl-prolyl cis-trans isomerase FKBP6 [Orchesella cincta]